MKKFGFTIALAVLSSASLFVGVVGADAAVAADGQTAVTPVVGKMLYSTGGKKLAAIYKLSASGDPQILLQGKMLTVSAATLSEADGKLQTSLTMKDLMSGH